jgi:beta-glucosidase
MRMDVEQLISELTLDEKALLTAGADMWTTPAIERLGIPPIKVTDGPNGARGSSLLGLGEVTAVCVPCGSALGATWSPELVERVGGMLGQETRTKCSRVLLAPTINLHRSPLGGRNFECYSEDPLLSGKIAAGFIRGVQSEGVATTAKHFVANDAEFERNTINSVVDERTLREIYLVPFELAVKEGGALGIMTSYNRLNGTYCSEHPQLLRQILRDEWGFEGFVLTDWFSAGSSDESPRAGLDLQMPGPGRFYGPALAEAVRAGEVEEALVDAQVRRMLSVWDRIGALADPPSTQETSIDRPEHRTLAREAASEAMVLLKNDDLLPLDADSIERLAVIGPNADRGQIMGGGSAALRPHYRVTPLDALGEKLGDSVEIVHARGAWTEKTTPAIAMVDLEAGADQPGLQVDFYPNQDCSGEPTYSSRHADGQLLYFGRPSEVLPSDGFSFKASGRFTPTESGIHTLSLVQAGRARVEVDGEVFLDGFADPPPPGEHFLSMGSQEVEAPIELQAGRPVQIDIEFASADARLLKGMKLGHRPPIEADLLAQAEAVAADADAVVLIVGTNADWETEGRDRESMDLPGDQDELVRRVCAANPRTLVCVNTGAPVHMDWADAPAAILQTWFGGQGMAAALADVVFGDAEPAGRLPTTLPLRIEHGPAHGNFPGENSELRYGEGLLMGYRWFQSRRLPVRFAFGHGLSYARFEIGAPRLSADSFGSGATIRVEVPVSNVGTRRGAEVVQCYVAPGQSRLFRPERELRAFEKVWLDPGETRNVTLELGDRAFAYWDPGDRELEALNARQGIQVSLVLGGKRGGGGRRSEPGWYVDAGHYDLHIGRASDDIAHVVPVTVAKDGGPLAP